MGAYAIIPMFSIFFIILGLISSKQKEPVKFWSNVVNYSNIKDIPAYNKAVGILFIIFGIIFGLASGTLFLGDIGAIIFIFLVVIEVLAMMIIYTLVIETKYRKK
jgi:hypothetical protein